MIAVSAIKNHHGAEETPGKHLHRAKAKPSCFSERSNTTPSRNETCLRHSDTKCQAETDYSGGRRPRRADPCLAFAFHCFGAVIVSQCSLWRAPRFAFISFPCWVVDVADSCYILRLGDCYLGKGGFLSPITKSYDL